MTIFHRLTGLATRAEIPVLIAIAPALLFPSPQRLWVLVMPPLLWACAYAATGQALPPTRFNRPLLMILAMVPVSLIVSTDIHSSLGKVCGLTLGILLFWAIARWLKTPARLKLAVTAYVAAGAILSVIGLLGTKWIFKYRALGIMASHLPPVIRGVPGAEDGFNPNAVAGCLVLFVPVQIALLAGGAHRWLVPSPAHALRMAVVLIQMLLLILTVSTTLFLQSIGGWLSLLAALGAFLLWHSRISRLVLMAAAVVVMAVAFSAGPQQFVNRTFSREGSVAASTVDTRIELWSMALAVIRDAPLTGVGMNGFRRIGPERYPTLLLPPGADAVHAHNNLLQAALDLGLPGLAAYVATWAIAGWLLVTVYRRSSDAVYRALAGGLTAGLIAHFTFGIGDAIPLGAKVGVLFWLTLALVEGLYQVTDARPAGIPAPSQNPAATSGA